MGVRMKTFQMTADITFQAENIDDAFVQLKKHFELLTLTAEEQYQMEENDPALYPDLPRRLEFIGSIKVRPV